MGASTKVLLALGTNRALSLPYGECPASDLLSFIKVASSDAFWLHDGIVAPPTALCLFLSLKWQKHHQLAGPANSRPQAEFCSQFLPISVQMTGSELCIIYSCCFSLSEDFLGHPDLKPEIQIENVPNLLSPEVLDALKNDYIHSIKVTFPFSALYDSRHRMGKLVLVILIFKTEHSLFLLQVQCFELMNVFSSLLKKNICSWNRISCIQG